MRTQVGLRADRLCLNKTQYPLLALTLVHINLCIAVAYSMHRCINYHARWMLVKRRRWQMADSKNLWGGRFKGKPDPGFAKFNSSFRFDRRLFEADVTASLAYARALAGAGVLTIDESTAITSALAPMLGAAQADP